MSTAEKLAQPFPPDRVSWRVGSMTKDKSKARALAYIDARDVMQRLDDVVGPANWQCEYSDVAPIIVCKIAIKFDGEWVWKANGAGQTDIEAEKGGASDAFKRAAVLWGIGRYLYDIDAPWVQVNEWKQIADHEMPKLRALLGGAKPAPKSESRDTFKSLTEGLRLCPSLPAIDDYLASKADALARMPEGWRKNWDDQVSAHREHVQKPKQRAA